MFKKAEIWKRNLVNLRLQKRALFRFRALSRYFGQETLTGISRRGRAFWWGAAELIRFVVLRRIQRTFRGPPAP